VPSRGAQRRSNNRRSVENGNGLRYASETETKTESDMFEISFCIETDPVPKARARCPGRFSKTRTPWTPKTTAEFERKVAISAKKAMGESLPTDLPLVATMIFLMRVPGSRDGKRLSKSQLAEFRCGLVQHDRKPDLDNLKKSVLDGMNEIVYNDDGQVVLFEKSFKRYAMDGETPCVLVRLREATLEEIYGGR